MRHFFRLIPWIPLSRKTGQNSVDKKKILSVFPEACYIPCLLIQCQTSDVDADHNIEERKSGDVAPKLCEVESDSNSGTNESIKIIITSSLGTDEFPSSPIEQDTSGIFEISENTAQVPLYFIVSFLLLIHDIFRAETRLHTMTQPMNHPCVSPFLSPMCSILTCLSQNRVISEPMTPEGKGRITEGVLKMDYDTVSGIFQGSSDARIRS